MTNNWDTTVTIHDKDRRQFWLEVVGTDTLPIISIVPIVCDLPQRPLTSCYQLDVYALPGDMQDKLIAALSQKFQIQLSEARSLFFEQGVPVPVDGCIAQTTNHGLMASLLDDDFDFTNSDYNGHGEYWNDWSGE